jgi:hypothetical protein
MPGGQVRPIRTGKPLGYKTIKAKNLRIGDVFAHESQIGFVVIDMAQQGDQLVLLIRAGINEHTITLRPNQPVDIFD